MTVATCLALLLLSQQPAAPAAPATLRGKVVDPDGRPIAEATVVALAIGTDREFIGLAALTKKDGTFEITGVPESRVIVRAQPRGTITTGQVRTPVVIHPPVYFPGTLERREAWAIDVKPGEIIELDIHMPPVFIGSIKTTLTGPAGYTLEHLRVIRPESNQIKNVILAENGIGFADELREGKHAITARARLRDTVLVASQTVELTGGEVSVALTLAPGARLRGVVIGDHGQMPPLDNLRVIATWTDRTSDLDPLARDESYVAADGSFVIDGLFGERRIQVAGLPDEWQVSIRYTNTDITSQALDFSDGKPKTIAIYATLKQRPAGYLEPPPLAAGTASIHGRVIDALTGKPIEGADVRLSDSVIEQEIKRVDGRAVSTRMFVRSNRTFSQNDGSYAFDGIREGAYRLFLLHPMYLPSCMPPGASSGSQCNPITVAADQRVNDANSSMHPGAIIRGRVLDKDGHPVKGASVKPEFTPPDQGGANSAMTDANGRFDITSVPPGQMLIRVEPPGGRLVWHRTMYYPGVHERDAAQYVTAEVGKAAEIEIRLRDIPVATIRSALSGPEGFRVHRMTLVNPDTRMLINMPVAGDGTASAPNLDEGRYVVSATAMAGSQPLAAYQLIIVGAGEYDVPLHLEPTATITGRVVADRGGAVPIDGVTVEAHWINGNLKLDLTGPERVSVNPDGSFAMGGLFGRRQILLFGLPDEWHVVRVRAGRSDATSGIDLASGSTTEIEIVVSRQ